MKKEPVVMPEGWVVDDPTSFRFLVDHTPPRAFAVAYALRMDARDWKVIALWLVGTGCIAAGAALRQWPVIPWLLIPLGGVALSWWFACFLLAARSFRSEPLLTGIIDRVHPHPLGRDCLAKAELPGGRMIPVALPAKPALDLIERHGLAEVVFLRGCGLAFGVRPVPGGSNDWAG